MEEYRFYYDENGNYVGGIFDTDPIPSGWEAYSYTLLTPPSILGPSIDYPDGPAGVPIEKFDEVDNEWYVPFTLERLKKHRDNMISVEIEYNNGTQTFDILNNIPSYTGLCCVCTGIVIENNPMGTVNWKNLSGDYIQASYADVQELYKRCYRREQDCRDAEAFVLDTHAVTPYVKLADAATDFLTQL